MRSFVLALLVLLAAAPAHAGELDDVVERLEGKPGEQARVTLERNRDLLRNHSLPPVGARRTYGDDPLVFQRFAGHGMQVHPLATAGYANALAPPCLDQRRREARVDPSRTFARAALMRLGVALRAPRVPRARRGPRCRPEALRRVLDRIADIAADRKGFAAWEYHFDFGHNRAPWISGMTQATVAQALIRGAVALREDRYAALAHRALGAFEHAPPVGVRVRAPRGVRYALYSGQPDLDVLNGFLQAVIGLEEIARRTGSPRARALFTRAEPAARVSVAAFDTGAWSRYSRGGREASLGYHRLVRRFLGRLCDRLRRGAYCQAERRFARYEREAPRVRLGRSRVVRAQGPAGLTVSISKVSRARVLVTSRRGTALDRRLTLPRGRHGVSWVPRRRGTYVVRVSAVGPEGRRTVVRTRVRVGRSVAELEARRREAARQRDAFRAEQDRARRDQRRALRRAR